MRARPGRYLTSLCLSVGLLTACQAGTSPATTASSKINPQVEAAAQALQQGVPTSAHTDAQGRLLVYVYVTDTTPDTLAQLNRAGLIDPRASAVMGVVQGWVAPRNLDGLAALSCVKTVTFPRYAAPR